MADKGSGGFQNHFDDLGIAQSPQRRETSQTPVHEKHGVLLPVESVGVFTAAGGRYDQGSDEGKADLTAVGVA